MPKKKLFLLDGMALAYRAHFAFISSNLRNSEGIPTGPVLGFANTLEKMLDKEEPTHIGVAWDTHAPTFRHEMDEAYKANRPPQPEELKTGIPLIKEMLECYGIQNIQQDGYEADDLIGTIAAQANAEDVEVFMVTPDKDFMQLVHDHVKMYKPDNRNGGFNIIGREGVKKYFGVYPEKVIDVLAILGDKSDNIPGVKGIGKKGAPKLINKYGSLENAIEDAPNIKGKRAREGLTNYAAEALHAKKMVKIVTDISDVVEWEDLTWKKPKGEACNNLVQLFKKLEFRSLTKKYLTAGVTVEKEGLSAEASGQADLFEGEEGGRAVKDGLKRYDEDETEYIFVDTTEKLEATAEELKGAEQLCFDTETTGVDGMSSEVVGISLCAEEGKAWYIPVNVDTALDKDTIFESLQPLFGNEETMKVAHNFKFDAMMLQRAGLKIKGPVFDTMLAGYLIDADQNVKLDLMARKYLNYAPVPIVDLIGKGKNQKTMDQLDPQEICVYACEDADVTLRLYHKLKPLLDQNNLTKLADELEFPLIEVLSRMERHGVFIDHEKLKIFSGLLSDDLRGIRKKIYEKAGHEFNINSPKQLGVVLFEELELPAGKKTKTGQYSTSVSVLTKLAAKHEIPDWILEYRALHKLKATYVDALPELINEQTGRIHSDFNQHVASTGRLSSSNPNLQNIPIRTERGREIRKAFIAEEGFKLLSADYSQVELRVIAAIAEDENMMQAFENDEDIHSRTAMEVFELESMDEVTSEHRRKAKEVNFGIPYGVSAYGLASRLGISKKEGKAMIDQYFERFPGILEYINETKQFAKEHGYVKTLMGRRRYIPQINSGNWNVRSFAERMAINMPIQGAAADIIKKAMIDIHEYLHEEGLKSRMLLQVHDELIFEIVAEEEEKLPAKLKELMENAVDLSVPLKVEMGLADNWLDAH